jgi:hypothetical protein
LVIRANGALAKTMALNQGRKERKEENVPVASVSDLNTLRSMSVLVFGLPVAGLLGDVDILAVLGTTQALFFGDADLFLDVGVAAVGRGSVDGG